MPHLASAAMRPNNSNDDDVVKVQQCGIANCNTLGEGDNQVKMHDWLTKNDGLTKPQGCIYSAPIKYALQIAIAMCHSGSYAQHIFSPEMAFD